MLPSTAARIKAAARASQRIFSPNPPLVGRGKLSILALTASSSSLGSNVGTMLRETEAAVGARGHGSDVSSGTSVGTSLRTHPLDSGVLPRRREIQPSDAENPVLAGGT
jgi:hypothetical protein